MTRIATIGLASCALALAIVLAVAPAPVAACAAAQQHLELLISLAGPRPRGAGFVVVREDGPRGARWIEDLNRVRLIGPGQRTIALEDDSVATDVWVLRPVALPPAGRYELRGVSPDPVAIELGEVPTTPPPRPRVRRLRVERDTMGGPGLEARTLRLDLSGPIPPRSVVIAEWTEDGQPASTYGRVSADSARPSAALASSRPCAGHGRFPPRGARVTFRLVDSLGQVSPPTRPVRAP